jgi:hypothetical protein
MQRWNFIVSRVFACLFKGYSSRLITASGETIYSSGMFTFNVPRTRFARPVRVQSIPSLGPSCVRQRRILKSPSQRKSSSVVPQFRRRWMLQSLPHGFVQCLLLTSGSNIKGRIGSQAPRMQKSSKCRFLLIRTIFSTSIFSLKIIDTRTLGFLRRGYTEQNTRLVDRKCHRKSQREKGLA